MTEDNRVVLGLYRDNNERFVIVESPRGDPEDLEILMGHPGRLASLPVSFAEKRGYAINIGLTGIGTLNLFLGRGEDDPARANINGLALQVLDPAAGSLIDALKTAKPASAPRTSPVAESERVTLGLYRDAEGRFLIVESPRGNPEELEVLAGRPGFLAPMPVNDVDKRGYRISVGLKDGGSLDMSQGWDADDPAWATLNGQSLKVLDPTDRDLIDRVKAPKPVTAPRPPSPR